MIVANISLDGFGSYCLPVTDMSHFAIEVQAAAECQELDSKWTVTLSEMSQEEYDALDEFQGY